MESHILNVDKVGPAIVVISEPNRPCRSTDVLFLNAVAVKVAPIGPAVNDACLDNNDYNIKAAPVKYMKIVRSLKDGRHEDDQDNGKKDELHIERRQFNLLRLHLELAVSETHEHQAQTEHLDMGY